MVKNPANAGDMGLNPESGRSQKGNGNPLQYSCLELLWTERPGGLQSMESEKRVRRDRASKQVRCRAGLWIQVRLALPCNPGENCGRGWEGDVTSTCLGN